MSLEEIQKVLDKVGRTARQVRGGEEEGPRLRRAAELRQPAKPAPVKLWDAGRGNGVDAPVAVAGGKVHVASAFLDKEQVGERALFCLDAKTGGVTWQARLKLNPWGGPTVAGNLVVVSGSSIGYDPKALKGAKGEVVAFNLEGKEKWRADVTGGVLSCVAVADKSVIATATDGKLRAFDLETGERKWAQVYDAKAPFFAAPAVVGGVVYAADLNGVVHAVNLADGKGKWTLDLATHPDVKAPGMVYGGPVVHGGRLFVATCNLEGGAARQGTVVVCIGDK
jgi:outer membrane protein assembly factor BamB